MTPAQSLGRSISIGNEKVSLMDDEYFEVRRNDGFARAGGTGAISAALAGDFGRFVETWGPRSTLPKSRWVITRFSVGRSSGRPLRSRSGRVGPAALSLQGRVPAWIGISSNSLRFVSGLGYRSVKIQSATALVLATASPTLADAGVAFDWIRAVLGAQAARSASLQTAVGARPREAAPTLGKRPLFHIDNHLQPRWLPPPGDSEYPCPGRFA